MAHFLKPKNAGKEGFKQRADGVLTAMSIKAFDKSKDVVLWGGGNGGEVLSLVAYNNKGKLMANCYLVGQEKHAYDPDGDHLWYNIYRVIPYDAHEGTGTLTAVDKKGMPFVRIALSIEKGGVDVKLASGGTFAPAQEASVDISSFASFRMKTAKKGETLRVSTAFATVAKMRFEVTRAGTTFHVGACVPEGTVDFTKAYIFFHPDTMEPKDTPNYAKFTGRWTSVERYTSIMGVQGGQVRKTVVLIPFMTIESRSNQGNTNVFGDHGLETLDAILHACATAVKREVTGPVNRVGVLSYSSGIQHLVRFANKLGGTGIIREQFDLDGPHWKAKHNSAPKLKSAKNVTVSQDGPTDPSVEWIHLHAGTWTSTAYGPPTDHMALHENIGKLTARALIAGSVMS